MTHVLHRRLAQGGDELLDQLLPPRRRGADLPAQVAQVDHAVLAADAVVLVELELLLGVLLLEAGHHLVGQLADEQLVVAGDLQALHQFLERRVPHVALGGGDLGAGKEDDIAAGDDPVMAGLVLLGLVGDQGVVLERGVAAEVVAAGLGQDLPH